MNPRRLILFLISALSALLGAWFVQRGLAARSTLLELQGWPHAQGTFIAGGVGVEPHPARKNVRAWYAPTWRYRFTVDGRERTGSSNGTPDAFVVTPFDTEADALAAARRRVETSETVDVTYDPNDPAKNTIDLPPPEHGKWLFWAGLGAALLIISLGGVMAAARGTSQPRGDATR